MLFFSATTVPISDLYTLSFVLLLKCLCFLVLKDIIKVGKMLHQVMHIISGAIKSTPTPDVRNPSIHEDMTDTTLKFPKSRKTLIRTECNSKNRRFRCSGLLDDTMD